MMVFVHACFKQEQDIRTEGKTGRKTPVGARTHEDDTGLQLVGECEGGLNQLLGLAVPLALQQAWLHADEVGTRLLCQSLIPHHNDSVSSWRSSCTLSCDCSCEGTLTLDNSL